MNRGVSRPAAGVVLTVAAALTLAGCGGSSLPATVQAGTSVTVGWSGTLTTANPALPQAGAGDADIASMTRGHFAQVVEGQVQTDPSFGAVSIVTKSPFTVRYDLAQPTWSDGIGVDVADLLLAWAAGTGAESGFTTSSDNLARGKNLVTVDEPGRALEVSFSAPEPEWQSALEVAVPAHVVGQLAFGLDDPMEAKKRVMDAVVDGDRGDLEAMALVWNSGFNLSAGAPDPALLLSNGPYRIEKVDDPDAAQRVTLVANRAYSGSLSPTYERIVVHQLPDADRLAALGKRADVVPLTPTRQNRIPVRDRERRDHSMTHAGDGTLWVLLVRPTSVVVGGATTAPAFLRNVPRDALIAGGAGPWADVFSATDSFLFDPGSADYQIAVEDSGFATRLGTGDGVDELRAAGIKKNASICVGFDSSSAFARGAVDALATAMAEYQLVVRRCGVPGLRDPAKAPGADVVLVNVPIPNDPDQVARLWGGEKAITGLFNNGREPFLDDLLRATDRFDARDARVEVEKTLVAENAALPIAINPHVALSVPQVSGVKLRPGAVAPLLSGAAEWSPTS